MPGGEKDVVYRGTSLKNCKSLPSIMAMGRIFFTWKPFLFALRLLVSG